VSIVINTDFNSNENSKTHSRLFTKTKIHFISPCLQSEMRFIIVSHMSFRLSTTKRCFQIYMSSFLTVEHSHRKGGTIPLIYTLYRSTPHRFLQNKSIIIRYINKIYFINNFLTNNDRQIKSSELLFMITTYVKIKIIKDRRLEIVL